jgi:hypothetical protein
MKKLSSIPATLLAWFVGGVLPIFFGLYFFGVVALKYSSWFWFALIAAVPIVLVGVIWIRFMRRMTFQVLLDPEKKMLHHGQPLQQRPVTGRERCEFRRYGSLWYAYLQFPDGTGVSFIPGLFLYGEMKREGAQRRWNELVNEVSF